jgi:hypothetical protein
LAFAPVAKTSIGRCDLTVPDIEACQSDLSSGLLRNAPPSKCESILSSMFGPAAME